MICFCGITTFTHTVTKVTPKIPVCFVRLGRSAPSMRIRSPIYMRETSENDGAVLVKGGNIGDFTAPIFSTLGWEPAL